MEGMTREASQQVARAEDKLSHSRDQQMTSHTKLKQAEQAKEEAISNIETAKATLQQLRLQKQQKQHELSLAQESVAQARDAMAKVEIQYLLKREAKNEASLQVQDDSKAMKEAEDNESIAVTTKNALGTALQRAKDKQSKAQAEIKALSEQKSVVTQNRAEAKLRLEVAPEKTERLRVAKNDAKLEEPKAIEKEDLALLSAKMAKVKEEHLETQLAAVREEHEEASPKVPWAAHILKQAQDNLKTTREQMSHHMPANQEVQMLMESE